MKYLIIALLLIGSTVMAQELRNVEKLTDTEIAQIKEVKIKIQKAQSELLTLQAQIAKAHNMGKEGWMEWETWYEFEGDYIKSYFRSNMMPSELITQTK